MMESSERMVNFENNEIEITQSLQRLVPFGLPLFEELCKEQEPVSPELLLQNLEELGARFDQVGSFSEREHDALCAFLNAISTHFRKTWNQVPNCLRLYHEQHLSSRSLVRLRRIALAQLGRYL